MGSLDAFLGNQVKTQCALVLAKELIQRRVGRRTVCGAADLQHMLCSIFRDQTELMDRKFLDGAYAGAGNKIVLHT